MIQILALILGFYCFYKIYINRGNWLSLLWVLIPMILINGMVVVTNFPLQMPIARWLIFSLLFVHLIYWKRFKLNWRLFPLKKIMLIAIIVSFLIGILDSRLSLFDKLYVPIQDITNAYFIMFLGYLSVSNEKDIYKLAKPLYYVLIVIGVYGILNFVTKSNPYYEFIVNTFFQGGDTDTESRMRVLDVTETRYRATSTFDMTFNYGYVSTLLALFFLFLFSVSKKKIKYVRIAIVLGLVGTLLCFSRTVLVAGVFAIFLYLLMTYRKSKVVVGVFVFFVLTVLGYSSITVIQTSIDNVLDIFTTGGKNTNGSSVSMREAQTLGAYKYFLQKPVTGNGYGYINKELGWGDRDNAVLDDDMFGFESVLYVWLIEQGIIGTVSKIALIVSTLIFFIKKRKAVNKKIASLGIAMLVFFIVFSFATGTLGTWPFTMLYLGMLIKTIQLNERNKIEIKRYEVFNLHTSL